MFEQERTIGRLQRRVIDAPDIFACFLSGSYGRRANDEYSDLDVALIYSDDQTLERAWRNRIQFAESIMPYISLKSFDAEHVRPYFHIVLFANGSKIDFRFEAKDSLLPNPWDGQIRILKDSAGWAENFRAKSGQMVFPQPGISNQELRLLDQRFWAMYWDILRLLARGDAEKSFPIYLELLHFTFPRLLEVLPLGAPVRASLITAQFNRDANINAKHMRGLLSAYIAARQVIIDHYHLQLSSDQSFEQQIQRLVEKVT